LCEPIQDVTVSLISFTLLTIPIFFEQLRFPIIVYAIFCQQCSVTFELILCLLVSEVGTFMNFDSFSTSHNTENCGLSPEI